MRNLIVSILLTILAAPFSKAQSYEQIYPVATQDVQNRMNTNKVNGVNILTGIYSKHVLGLSGLTESNKIDIESSLNDNSDVQAITISSDLHSITIYCKTTYTFNQIKELFSSHNVSVIGNSVEYSVEEN